MILLSFLGMMKKMDKGELPYEDEEERVLFLYVFEDLEKELKEKLGYKADEEVPSGADEDC